MHYFSLSFLLWKGQRSLFPPNIQITTKQSFAVILTYNIQDSALIFPGIYMYFQRIPTLTWMPAACPCAQWHENNSVHSNKLAGLMSSENCWFYSHNICSWRWEDQAVKPFWASPLHVKPQMWVGICSGSFAVAKGGGAVEAPLLLPSTNGTVNSNFREESSLFSQLLPQHCVLWERKY